MPQGKGTISTLRSHRGSGDGTPTQEKHETREAPAVAARDRQPEACEGQTGPQRGDGKARSTIETG